MRKLKIFITILMLYEIVVVTILQISGFCNTFFNRGFCEAGNFKYFLMCFVLPGLLMLLLWWMPELSRQFCKNKCQCQCEEQNLAQPQHPQKETDDIISRDDMERLVTGAIIMGIQKFASMHPKTTKAFNNIITALQNTKKIKKK